MALSCYAVINFNRKDKAMKNVTIRIPEEMHEELRKKSYEERKSINSMLLEALRHFLDTGKEVCK
jgi:predicted HicB family RNase H-like nuclease